jgi:hypothetical protein
MASAISLGDGNAGLQAGNIYGSVHTTFHQRAGKSRDHPAAKQLTNVELQRPP